MGALAAVGPAMRVLKLQAETLARLAHQARLQIEQRRDGRDRFDLLPLMPGKGFGRLSRPDPGDVFFDIEGDPHIEGGLEYLFGLVHEAKSEPRFVAFWTHDRAEEKRAFQAAIDFMVKRLAAHPGAHVLPLCPLRTDGLEAARDVSRDARSGVGAFFALRPEDLMRHIGLRRFKLKSAGCARLGRPAVHDVLSYRPARHVRFVAFGSLRSGSSSGPSGGSEDAILPTESIGMP